MPTLELYFKPTCPYCAKVMLALDTLNQGRPAARQLQVRQRNIDADPAARSHLVEVGGRPTVPCLFIDGKPLYESDDIIRFLQETAA